MFPDEYIKLFICCRISTDLKIEYENDFNTFVFLKILFHVLLFPEIKMIMKFVLYSKRPESKKMLFFNYCIYKYIKKKCKGNSVLRMRFSRNLTFLNELPFTVIIIFIFLVWLLLSALLIPK